MELDHVQIVGTQPLQALLDACHDVFAGEDVWRSPFAGGRGRVYNRTAALGGQEELGPPGADESPDAIFAQAIVDGRVDVIDSGVDDRLQDGLGLFVADYSPARGAAELHRPVAKLGHLQPRASEGARRQFRHESQSYWRNRSGADRILSDQL